MLILFITLKGVINIANFIWKILSLHIGYSAVQFNRENKPYFSLTKMSTKKKMSQVDQSISVVLSTQIYQSKHPSILVITKYTQGNSKIC